MTKENTGFGRKVLDYLIFGSGIAGVTDGITRIVYNPPQQLINAFNFNNGNWQYQIGCIDIMVGGFLLAYGIEGIVHQCKSKDKSK